MKIGKITKEQSLKAQRKASRELALSGPNVMGTKVFKNKKKVLPRQAKYKHLD